MSEQSELPGKRYESRVASFASLRCGSATVGRVGGEWPLMGIPRPTRIVENTNYTQGLRNVLEGIAMSRESEWVKFVLHEEFPSDVEFLEGSAPNHVVVEWLEVGPDDAPRRNAPFVIVIDTEAIDRYESGNLREQSRIASRIREIVRHRGVHYEPSGPVDVSEPFVVEIDEGDL
jgi:hypothetical protein